MRRGSSVLAPPVKGAPEVSRAPLARATPNSRHASRSTFTQFGRTCRAIESVDASTWVGDCPESACRGASASEP